MIAKFCVFWERKGERYLGTKAVEVVRRAKVILMLAVGLSYSEIGKRLSRHRELRLGMLGEGPLQLGFEKELRERGDH